MIDNAADLRQLSHVFFGRRVFGERPGQHFVAQGNREKRNCKVPGPQIVKPCNLKSAIDVRLGSAPAYAQACG
jgi:hypothetical protein